MRAQPRRVSVSLLVAVVALAATCDRSAVLLALSLRPDEVDADFGVAPLALSGNKYRGAISPRVTTAPNWWLGVLEPRTWRERREVFVREWLDGQGGLARGAGSSLLDLVDTKTSSVQGAPQTSSDVVAPAPAEQPGFFGGIVLLIRDVWACFCWMWWLYLYCIILVLLVMLPFGLRWLGCGTTRKCDCRKMKCCARLLLSHGYDEFETFSIRITTHSVKDVVNSDWFGRKSMFKVTIACFWSLYETSATSDMRWEETRTMVVPQGSSRCRIRLVKISSFSLFKGKIVGEYNYDIKDEMLDNPDFWDVRQKIRLTKFGSAVGDISLTFHKVHPDDKDQIPIGGVDEDTALAMELIKAYQELLVEPGFVPLPNNGKLEGVKKLQLLAKVLEGNVLEVDCTNGSEKGTLYAKVIGCNFAELQGDKMNETLLKQYAKAEAQGMPKGSLEQKWYWVWYSGRADADDVEKWHYPLGFIPLTQITSVHRSPERSDQFLLRQAGGNATAPALIYRRQQGKGLDVWIDGLDLAFKEARLLAKEKLESKAKEERR